jgi:hypothetical protein
MLSHVRSEFCLSVEFKVAYLLTTEGFVLEVKCSVVLERMFPESGGLYEGFTAEGTFVGEVCSSGGVDPCFVEFSIGRVLEAFGALGTFVFEI